MKVNYLCVMLQCDVSLGNVEYTFITSDAISNLNQISNAFMIPSMSQIELFDQNCINILLCAKKWLMFNWIVSRT